MFLRKLNKFIPYAFYSLLVLFLFVYLKNIDFNEFSSAQFNWYYLLISGLFALATRFWQVAIWFSLLKGLGAKNIKDSRSELTFVYAKSWLGRYIPGTAPWILGKIYFASKHGISKNKLAVSSMLEGVLQITVVMAMAFMMLLFDSRLNVIDIKFKLIMITALIVCVIAILPPIFNRIISAASRIVKRGRLSDDHKADSKTILTGSVMYAVGALLSGISLFFIAKAVYPGLEILTYSLLWEQAT